MGEPGFGLRGVIEKCDTHHLLGAGVTVFVGTKVGVFGAIVIVGPFHEMIGQVEPAIIVGAIFKIDYYELIAGRIVPENVPLLEVVVTEHYWRCDFGQVRPVDEQTIFLRLFVGVPVTVGQITEHVFGVKHEKITPIYEPFE